MTLRARVDQDTCISAGNCVADAPSAFAFDDDEIAQTVEDARSLGDDRLKTVARNCPSGAIKVFDGDIEVPTV